MALIKHTLKKLKVPMYLGKPKKRSKSSEKGAYTQYKIKYIHNPLNKYFNMIDSYLQSINLSFTDTLVAVETNLKQSIRDRMTTSDIEVGAFLSGGIDSNLIVAMAAQISNSLRTFTVKFDGLYDESKLARITSDQYQTKHTELEISFDVKNDIDHILARYGEPFMDSSAIPSYYIAREAKKHVTVVLNGDGGDELFGGYRRYVPFASTFFNFVKPVSWIQKLLPKPQQKRNAYDFVYRLLSLSRKKGLDFYLSATSNIYEDIHVFQNNPIMDEMNKFIVQTLSNQSLTALSKVLYLDFNLLLFSDLLVKMDIATMTNSLEVRSPFLSQSMLEFVPSIPDQYKIKGFTTKYILRSLAKKYLLPDLVNQPKRGFEVPLRKWIEEDLKEHIYDRLRPGCYAENYVGKELIDKLLKSKNNISPERRANMVWSLFCLETWYTNEKQYIS